MKIATLYCACNGQSNNPIDHYQSGQCTALPMPLGWIMSILREQTGDKFHRDMNITTTRITQSCAREVAILDNVPVYGYDVRRGNSMHWGNIMHKDLQDNTPAGAYAELLIPPEGMPAPVVCGIELRGKLDNVTPDLSEISDYKGHSESKQRNVKKYPPENEQRAQLSIYGFMISRTFSVPFPKLKIWHGAHVAAGGDPWIPQEIQPMSEQEILDMTPYGSDFTVAQCVSFYKQFKDDLAGGMELEAAIKRIPLMGRRMFKGSKCLKYCVAKEICDRIEGVAGL